MPQSTVTSSVAPFSASARIALDVRAVAFEDAVGNVDQRLEPARRRKRASSARGGRAVDVVVAEDRDRSPRIIASAMRSAAASMPVTRVRIGHQPPHGRIEIGLDVVEARRRGRRGCAPAAPARRERCAIASARDGRALVEPVAPGAAGHASVRHRGTSALARRVPLARSQGRPSWQELASRWNRLDSIAVAAPGPGRQPWNRHNPPPQFHKFVPPRMVKCTLGEGFLNWSWERCFERS